METINLRGFDELITSELMSIDGGWTAEQWITGVCFVAGAAIGTAIAGPVGTYVGAEAGTLAAVGVGLACSLVCGAIGTAVAGAINN